MTRTTRQLPILDTLRVLFASLRSRRSELARALLLPVLCITSLHVYREVYRWTFAGDKEQYALVLTIMAIVQALLWALLAVSCHRVLLEDSDEPRMVDGVWLGWRQIKYCLLAIVIAIPLVVYYFSFAATRFAWFDRFGEDIPMYADLAVNWAILIPMQYLVSRVALRLPAAALQHQFSIAQAWALSKGNGWRITVILLVGPAISELVHQVSFPLWEIAGPVASGLRFVTSLAVGVISIGALSFAYRFLVEDR